MPALLAVALLARIAQTTPVPLFRPPAVPIAVFDPYFSIWSEADRLTDRPTCHWTGVTQPLDALATIDGKRYRIMGVDPADLPALPQISVEVDPTTTTYEMAGAGVKIELSFFTPRLPDDLNLFSWPVTYVQFHEASVDGKPHVVSFDFYASSLISVDNPSEATKASVSIVKNPAWILEEKRAARFPKLLAERKRSPLRTLAVYRVGTTDQRILKRKGDDTRIDWGHFYVAASASRATISLSHLPGHWESPPPHSCHVSLSDFGQSRFSQNQVILLAYNETDAIDYFGKSLKPYWTKSSKTFIDLLGRALDSATKNQAACASFDRKMKIEMLRVGDEKYVQLASLAYRQALAGCGLAVDSTGQPMLFTKENTSNGCISTVDVIYPTAPILLLLSPALSKAALAPVLQYAASPRWKFPFAPHDLGTYPRATGQVYGGGERSADGQMPVEESANMILLLAAIAKEEGNPGFAFHYWPTVTRWARYLAREGFDPANQLCTDDFAGPMAHNANLSVKAIEALAAYGRLCEMKGDRADADRYRILAKGMAIRWMQEANDGDHYRLGFDLPGTWSQKYNLVWNRALNLDVFPPSVAKEEIAFYLTQLRRFGLPLDSRRLYTKTDWSLWTATLATTHRDFNRIVDRIWQAMDATKSRVPLSDFYWTDSANDAGMHARPVVGGLFMPMYANASVRAALLSSRNDIGNTFETVPQPPIVKSIVPDALTGIVDWKWTLQRPSSNWFKPQFDDSSWTRSPGGFGQGSPGISKTVHTTWTTDDIWLRRTFTWPKHVIGKLRFRCYHDEDVQVYINGVLALSVPSYNVSYDLFPIRKAALKAIHAGLNVMAVHCHQTTGGQYIDVGIVKVMQP